MTLAEFDAFCASLPHTTHVTQWGGASVWKVGGKLFAVMWEGQGKTDGVTFKATPASFEILGGEPGLRPAPYLASRGMKWIQRYSDASMSDEDLKLYLRQSHTLVFDGLPRRLREALRAAE